MAVAKASACATFTSQAESALAGAGDGVSETSNLLFLNPGSGTRPIEGPCDGPHRATRLATVIARGRLACFGRQEMSRLKCLLMHLAARCCSLFLLSFTADPRISPSVPLLNPQQVSRVHSFTPVLLPSVQSLFSPLTALLFAVQRRYDRPALLPNNLNQHALHFRCGAEHPRRRPGRCSQRPQPPCQLPRPS